MRPELTCHAHRRQRLLEKMGEGVLVLAAGAEVVRNRDTHYPFRSDSYFHYLTGFPEPDAVLVLVAGPEPRQMLFCRDKDPEREIWTASGRTRGGARRLWLRCDLFEYPAR